MVYGLYGCMVYALYAMYAMHPSYRAGVTMRGCCMAVCGPSIQRNTADPKHRNLQHTAYRFAVCPRYRTFSLVLWIPPRQICRLTSSVPCNRRASAAPTFTATCTPSTPATAWRSSVSRSFRRRGSSARCARATPSRTTACARAATGTSTRGTTWAAVCTRARSASRRSGCRRRSRG